MPTTVLATALPHSLADDAPVPPHRLPHPQAGRRRHAAADFPAAAAWADTLAGCTLTLTTSLDPGTPCRCGSVSVADAASWAAVLPPDHPGGGVPDARGCRARPGGPTRRAG